MRRIAVPLVLLPTLFASLSMAADQPKPEDVIARHLDSIGTPGARAAVKSRGIQGALHFKVLSSGSGQPSQRGGNALGDEVSTTDADGYWGYVSQERKSNFVMKFGSGQWRGERFVFDGDKTSFAVFTNSHRPSSFGDFVRREDFILKEGLLGGELSTTWALENPDHSRAKLDYDGVKKVDGQDLDCIDYSSKADSDVKIKLYFDPETHHHVMTTYTLVVEPGIGYRPSDSARQHLYRYTIEERFSDFKTDNGLTLPRHYDLRFTQEPGSGASRAYEWDMTADKFMDNIGLDPGNFQVK